MEKLIRHRLAQQIQQRDPGAVLRPLRDDAERWVKLKEKLLEEVQEFVAAPSEFELADVMEVVYCLREMLGPEEVDKARNKKFLERGGFFQGLVLTV